jgi:uncharacterized membrane protein YgcG
MNRAIVLLLTLAGCAGAPPRPSRQLADRDWQLVAECAPYACYERSAGCRENIARALEREPLSDRGQVVANFGCPFQIAQAHPSRPIAPPDWLRSEPPTPEEWQPLQPNLGFMASAPPSEAELLTLHDCEPFICHQRPSTCGETARQRFVTAESMTTRGTMLVEWGCPAEFIGMQSDQARRPADWPDPRTWPSRAEWSPPRMCDEAGMPIGCVALQHSVSPYMATGVDSGGYVGGGGSGGSTGGGGGSGGTVYVNGYTRSNGTYVHGYTRSAPSRGGGGRR